MKKFEYTDETIHYVMNLIQNHLTPDLLLPKHREKNKSNPMYGHCKHASQALIELMDTDKLCLMTNRSHMWVQDGSKIYDITADEYFSIGLTPDYQNASPCQFRSDHLSTIELIKRVLESNEANLN